VRVRHHGAVARIEVPAARLAEVVSRRDEVTDVVRGAGFTYVSLDLEGFRSGSLNRMIGDGVVGSVAAVPGGVTVG
jgi:uncharacterized protein